MIEDMGCEEKKPCPALHGKVLVGRTWQIYMGIGVSPEVREKYLAIWRAGTITPGSAAPLKEVQTQQTGEPAKKGCGCAGKGKTSIAPGQTRV
jgi:hypothetical protein